jgi:hypothetical protein
MALEKIMKDEPEFMPRLEKVAANLGTRPEWLINVMMVETVGTLSPKIKNPRSTATGLIQFMEPTAKHMGTTTKALSKMSATQQLDYVEKYFERFKGQLTSQAAVYAAVGAGRVAHSDSSVMFTKQDGAAYSLNQGWDTNRDGSITQGEMGQVATKFGAGTQFTIDHAKRADSDDVPHQQNRDPPGLTTDKDPRGPA